MKLEDFIKIYNQRGGVEKLAQMLKVTTATVHNIKKRYKIPNKKKVIILD